MRRFPMLAATALALLFCRPALATPTRNQVLSVLPAPGPVKVDGKWDDWDLSGGILICGDVEHRINQYSVWLHAMYDDKGLYLLARWTDITPLNNPAIDDQGWQGDCLQVRLGFNPPGDSGVTGIRRGNLVRLGGLGRVRGVMMGMVSVSAWRSGAVDQLQVEYGPQYVAAPHEKVRNALARQAFSLYASHKGYVQELFIPWSLLSDSGKPGPGAEIPLLVQPNYSDDQKQHIGDVDVVSADADSAADANRGQYFEQPQLWGHAVFLEAGKITPPAVPLSDGKSYGVKLTDGLPVVDWQGLVTQDPPESKLELAPGLAPARQAEIAAAIAQLGADDAAARKAARAKVKAFGVEAQSLLEEHFNDPDPELSTVARELWNEIDEARRKSAPSAAAGDGGVIPNAGANHVLLNGVPLNGAANFNGQIIIAPGGILNVRGNKD